MEFQVARKKEWRKPWYEEKAHLMKKKDWKRNQKFSLTFILKMIRINPYKRMIELSKTNSKAKKE